MHPASSRLAPQTSSCGSLCSSFPLLVSCGSVKEWVSKRAHLAIPGDIWGCQNLGECLCLRVKARDVAKHFTVHSTASTTNSHPAPVSLVLRLRNPGLEGSIALGRLKKSLGP